jgi:serine/threonine protein kinase/tetratricopeptide (TPR) repeat protein
VSQGTQGDADSVPETHHVDSWEMPTFDETVLKPKGRDAELPPGLRIGPYAIERELGQGGMGTVYLATRADQAYEKKVAIKVTRGTLGSPDALERFRGERQILAHLEHQNIARLLDGGTTADGLPYLVMEYIEGKPLHAYCDDERLSTAARLRLFLQVCSAVEYAHHNLVVHRDLKPGNILVTADGVPRLLDFGIAKLIDPEAGAEATRATALALTPWYASPEQVKGEPISTATDVYSLGVVLYELLTGHGPYRLGTLTPLEVMKAVVEQEAEPPSSAIDRTVRLTSPDGSREARLTPFSVSRTREGTPERLRHRLRGDLDAILMMALRKEPDRRYPSVAAFAEDLRAYLTGRPVSARPDSAFYRASKFVNRNRWGVLAGLTIVALVLGAAANAFVQSRRVAHERDRAARVSKFLIDLFSVSDPGEARGNTVTAREVLDKGAEKIRHDLKEQPEVRADLLETIADVYNRLGLYDRAESLAGESLIFRRQKADDPRALAQSLNLLGNILMDKGDLKGAEAAYRESLELRRRAIGPDSIEVAQSLNNLSSVVDPLGRYDESDLLLQQSLEIKRKRLAADDPSLATSILNHGVNLYRRGDLAGAEKLLREALAIQRKALGEDHPEVAFSMQSVGVILDEEKKYDEAEKTYREALAIQRKVLGAQHPDIVTTLTNLANTLSHAGKLAAAAKVYREALPMSEKVYGRETTDTAHVLAGLADVELRQGRLAEAEALARESLATREKLLGTTHQDAAESLGLLGRVLLERGRYAEAEATLLRAEGVLGKPEVLESRRNDVRDALRRLYEKLDRPEDAARYQRS